VYDHDARDAWEAFKAQKGRERPARKAHDGGPRKSKLDEKNTMSEWMTEEMKNLPAKEPAVVDDEGEWQEVRRR
jgi:hypothetical protein